MLENIKAGESVKYNKFIFENYDIKENDEVYIRIIGKSYKVNDIITLSDLTYVKLLHYGYDKKIKVGELIINKYIIEEIKNIFNSLFLNKYEINSMKLIDDFWLDNDPDKSDRNSIIHNNSSAFCFRTISKKNVLSNHALGIAIDINPLDNPYITRDEDGNFDASNLSNYEKDTLIERDKKAKLNPHLITLDDTICKIFSVEGFECGGAWPLKSNKMPCDWQHFEPNQIKLETLKNKIFKKVNDVN